MSLAVLALGAGVAPAVTVTVPDPAAPLPELPGAPTVTVTPGGDGGASVDVGVGSENVGVGAGPGGLRVSRSARSSAPGSARDELPVSTPGDRPGDAPPTRRSASKGGGVVFGPLPRSATGAIRGSSEAPSRPGSTSRPFGARSGDASAPATRTRTKPLFFIAWVEEIPALVKVGLVALALLALGVWGAWVRTRRRIMRNAFVDPVTGLANAPAFDGLLARELERARRYKRPLALVVVDVSEMRLTMPPLLDHRLRDVTGAIQERTREGDIVARLGHSRFGIICPEATAAAAETLARALAFRLEEMRLHAVAGVAERQPTDLGPGDLVARAEDELPAPEREPDHEPRSNPLLRVA